MPLRFGSPKFWHERAEEAREVAEAMNDPEIKREMLKVAEAYEKIAKRAEAKEAGVNLAARKDQ